MATNNYYVKSGPRRLDLVRKEIIASLTNARRIQQRILQPIEDKQEDLGNSFIYYQPKDIVSGDFYWSYRICDQLILAVGDCSGHGVGGAMISMLAFAGLKKTVMDNRIVCPADILNKMNQYFHSVLEIDQTNHFGTIDLSLCKIDLTYNKLSFSGARNPLYLIRHGEKNLTILDGDRHSIGDYAFGKKHNYTMKEIDIQHGDMLYLFTDGYPDQLGGPDTRKLLNKNFRQLLLGICHKPLDKQKEVLQNFINTWRGDIPQTDDMCILAYKY